MHRLGQSRLSNILLILNLRSAYEKASRLGISKKPEYPRKFLRQTWAQAFCWWSVTFQSKPFFKIMRRRMLAKGGQTRAISFSPGMIFFKRPPDRLDYLSMFFSLRHGIFLSTIFITSAERAIFTSFRSKFMF